MLNMLENLRELKKGDKKLKIFILQCLGLINLEKFYKMIVILNWSQEKPFKIIFQVFLNSKLRNLYKRNDFQASLINKNPTQSITQVHTNCIKSRINLLKWASTNKTLSFFSLLYSTITNSRNYFTIRTNL